MTSKAQNVRVGLFAAASLALLAIVLIVFGGLRFWETSDRYHITFDSSVYGLQPGAEVFLNGIKVGAVDRVAVAPDDLRKVRVDIELTGGTPVRSDTRAMLQYAGITGLKVIDLRGGSLEAPPLPPGAAIAPGAGMLDKLEAQAEVMIDQSSQLIARANRLTDNLIAVTGELGAITDPARRAAENLEAATGSLHAMVDENRGALRATLGAVRQAADGTTQLVDSVDHRVGELFGGAGDVVGDLRKLIAANEGPLRAVMFDLRQASRNFKELVNDVRQRPSRLLFSSAASERRLP